MLSTAAGLVFHGETAGGFAAVDAKTGKTLWYFPTNDAWRASPMTLHGGGAAYVAVAAGSNIISLTLPDSGARGRARAMSRDLSRRTLVGGAIAAAAASTLEAAAPKAMPMVDTHIHLFDPNRPQGAPYRGPKTELGVEDRILPGDLSQGAAPPPDRRRDPCRCEPLDRGQSWALQTAETDPIMVGVIGNFRIESPDFPEIFARHAKNPSAARAALWQSVALRHRRAIAAAGVHRGAEAGVGCRAGAGHRQSAGRSAPGSGADQRPAARPAHRDRPSVQARPEAGGAGAYDAVLREIAGRPNVFVKLSSSLHEGNVSPRLADHKARLDTLFGTFGADRVLLRAVGAPGSWKRAVFAEKPLGNHSSENSLMKVFLPLPRAEISSTDDVASLFGLL